MTGRTWVCQNKDQLEIALEAIGFDWDWDKPLALQWKVHRSSRSIPANALYWVWLSAMAKHFCLKGGDYTTDQMHDLMRHKFLGYEDLSIGKTEIKQQLISTTKLNPTEFCYYMEQIDAWAAENSVLLPRPEDSEYSKYKEAQQ